MRSGRDPRSFKPRFFLESAPVVVVLALLLSSCPNFNEPVREFLEDWTNSAAIVRAEFANEYPKDADGITSIPSGAERTIRLVLRNPQDYNVAASLVIVDTADLSDNGCAIDPVADRRSLILRMNSEFLSDNEGGVDITSTTNIWDFQTGRIFEPFTLPLRCNTPPPPVTGSCVMVDADGNHVVCFALDLSNPIHTDITFLTVNGTRGRITFSDPSDITFVDNPSFTDDDLLPGLTPVGGPDGVTFSPPPGATRFYLRTGTPDSASNVSYQIRVLDARGLSSSATTYSQGEKLDPPSFSDVDSQALALTDAVPQDGETETATIRIIAPDSASETPSGIDGVSLSWQLLDEGGFLRDSGSGLSAIAFNAPPGTYTVNAFARKSGYVDSEVASLSLTIRRSNFWVHAEFGMDSGFNDGSQGLPYRSIQRAVDFMLASSGFRYTVNVTGMVNYSYSPENIVDIAFPCDLRIVGQGDGSGIESDGRQAITVAGAATTDIILEGLTIRNANTASEGGGILFSPATSGTLTMIRCILSGNRTTMNGGGLCVSLGSGLVTLTDCDFVGNQANGNGGGVRFRSTGDADLQMTDCVLIGNSSGNSGGGIDFESSTGLLSLSGCTIGGVASDERNTANNYGGGIHTIGDLAMSNCSVIGNITNDTAIGSGKGGGLYAWGHQVTINGTVFRNNMAKRGSGGTGNGGAIHLAGVSQTTLSRCTISNNVALSNGDQVSTGHGGGISANGGGMLSISVSSITGNSATDVVNGDGSGGGIFLGNSPATIDAGTTISGNRAGPGTSADGLLHGGGVFAGGGTYTICIMREGSSITANDALLSGGGAYVDSGATFRMEGGTISGNTAQRGAGAYVTGQFIDVNASVFSMQGGARVDPNNDIYLGIGLNAQIPLLITGELTGPTPAAILTPGDPDAYIPNIQVLAEPGPGLIGRNYWKFGVTPRQPWLIRIDETGVLRIAVP